MSSMSVLTDAELDAVTGGSFSINLVGIAIQSNSSTTNQGQVNANAFSFLTAQGGGQASVTAQRNSIG